MDISYSHSSNTCRLATLATRSVQVLLATAYAGRGGLNLLSLSQTLQNASGLPLFLVLMKAFPGATNANIADEVTSEGIMQGIPLIAAIQPHR